MNDDIFLDRADLFQLFMLSERVEKGAAAIGLKQQEAQINELTHQLKQTHLGQEMGQLQRLQARAIQMYNDHKKALSEKLGIDLDKAAIDDETGKVTLLPTS